MKNRREKSILETYIDGKAKLESSKWVISIFLSTLPILFISFLSSNYDRSELLLGLFFCEWILILVAWRLLCPWLGLNSTIIPAVLFISITAIGKILTQESLLEHGAYWAWSDDWWYLEEASRVVHSLQSSQWDFWEAWLDLISVWEGAAWTLAGWPYLLGVVSAVFSSENSPSLIHSVALSINATFLTIIPALVFHILAEKAERYPWLVVLSFLLTIGDPIVYAATSRKETMLQLSLMLAFVACMKIAKSFNPIWLISGFLGFLGVATTRPSYAPLIILMLYLSVCNQFRMSIVPKLTVAIILFSCLYGTLLEFDIRGSTFEELLHGKVLEADQGLGIFIYNIPAIGPCLFYIIAPVPMLPWQILYSNQIFTNLTRSVGSICWLFSFFYTLRAIFIRPFILKDGFFSSSILMFIFLFAATVIAGDDPRYKQPTNFYLSIMFFLASINSSLFATKHLKGQIPK